MKFEKVSLAQFTKDVKAYYPWLEDDAIEIMWQNITLPKRATAGSAGYDFYSPISVTMTQGVPVMIPTGIRVRIDRDKFLALVPRSGLGFKYGMRLSNTLGVIDFDYYGASNEGHIMAKVSCSPEQPLHIAEGDRFMQGIFLPYFTVEDDVSSATRTGGFGSTGISSNTQQTESGGSAGDTGGS